MNILSIIAKKRDNKKLNKEEIDYFIKEYTKGNITDYQAAALVMAIYINGMDYEEITHLTIAMSESGDRVDLSSIGKNVVDKHSTGGVGDKITIILSPIVAALGIPVAKMSGRGLGFTGGTADKLESIPGYRTEISEDEFIKNVKNIGISLITQTKSIAPADKKIYALRDTISCVDSIPLIASSIMSKKIASGADKIVLDVTVGSGAFMKTIENAIELSNTMINIGKLANKETVCILTNMDEPLGYSIGNNLEVIEAIECLQGKMSNDIKEVILELGSYMLKLSGKYNNIELAKKDIMEVIENGKAFNKFVELIQNQGGDIRYLYNTEMFQKSNIILPVIATEAGYIKKMNAEKIGKISCYLGAGRLKKEDIIDDTAGIILNKKVGDYLEKNEIIGYVHSNDKFKAELAVKDITSSIELSEIKVQKSKTIIEIVK